MNDMIWIYCFVWCQPVSVYKQEHTPDWYFFICFSFAPFLFFFFSSTGLSWLSESKTISDFLFLWCWSSGLLFLSAFLFFFTSWCSVCPSGRCCLCSVKLSLCFSFAFCCSLASNAWDRDSFEMLPSSSSPRYLWQNFPRYRFCSPFLQHRHSWSV